MNRVKVESISEKLVLALSLLLVACAPQQFEPVAISDQLSEQTPQSNEISSNFFKVASSTTVVEQPVLDQNQTSVSFQVQASDGTFLNDLSSSDLLISENGVPVSQFSLGSNAQNIVKPVDIVFAVDVTGSMTPTIESAKSRLINFVNGTRARGFHTRMCLVTFGDYTLQKCNKFYDNDPDNAATQSQVTELISEITKLRALKGHDDPGGSDLNENPMRALIDSSLAPWSADAQRFMILITDDGFLYSPGNQGAVGALAPKWSEVLSALDQSQMSVFVAAPDLAGYRKKFQGQDSIVTRSNGEFFLFADLIAGTITLDTILNRIISRVKTTYTISYVADEVVGLDASLSLSKRTITVTLANGVTGSIVSQTNQSNLPSGRANYRKSWKIDDKKILDGSVIVKINGDQIHTGYDIKNGEVIFQAAPEKGSKIEITYEKEDLLESVQFEPIVLSPSEALDLLSVLLNGRKATKSDVIFEKTLEGNYTLRPAPSVFSAEDKFKIRQNKGLLIKVLRTDHKTSVAP